MEVCIGGGGYLDGGVVVLGRAVESSFEELGAALDGNDGLAFVAEQVVMGVVFGLEEFEAPATEVGAAADSADLVDVSVALEGEASDKTVEVLVAGGALSGENIFEYIGFEAVDMSGDGGGIIEFDEFFL